MLLRDTGTLLNTKTALAFAMTWLLMSCGAGSAPGPSAPVTARPSPSATASPSPFDQATLRIKQADLDGDGGPDRLAFRWMHRSHRPPFTGAVRMTVTFDQGGSRRIVVPVDGWIDRFHQERPTVPFTAAAQLDGKGGDEVVIDVFATAASYFGHRVVTYRAGRLQFLPAPARHGWLVGGSVGTGGHTYDCPGRRLVAIDATPIRKGHNQKVAAYRVTRTAYVWRGGAWRLIERHVHTGGGISGSWVCPTLTGWLA